MILTWLFFNSDAVYIGCSIQTSDKTTSTFLLDVFQSELGGDLNQTPKPSLYNGPLEPCGRRFFDELEGKGDVLEFLFL